MPPRKLPAPDKPQLKDPKDFTLIGKPLKRLDTPEKIRRQDDVRHRCHGAGHEVRDACPVPGARRQGEACRRQRREKAARRAPGRRARRSRRRRRRSHVGRLAGARRAESDVGRRAERQDQSADIWNELRAASKKEGVVAKSEGDVEKGLTQGERFDADYELPFLAHACLEPQNCTVRLTPGACEIWTGTQVQSRAQEYAAKAAGLPIEKVTVYNHYIGGGFGRRLEPDMVETRCASPKRLRPRSRSCGRAKRTCSTMSIGRPIATRSPRSLSNGKIVAWKYQVSGSSIMARWLPPAFKERHRHRRRR